MPTAEQIDANYANLVNCDPATDVVVIEVRRRRACRVRASVVGGLGGRHPRLSCCSRRRGPRTSPNHCSRRSSPPQETTCEPMAAGIARRAVSHLCRSPRARLAADGGSGVAGVARLSTPSGSKPLWCVRDLDDIPDLALPDGVEIRAGHAGDDPPDPRSPLGGVSRIVGLQRGDRGETSSRPSTIRCATSRCGRSRGSATPSSAR